MPTEATTYGNESSETRLLSTYGSRGDVEPMGGLAVRLRALGAGVRVCALSALANLLARRTVDLVAAQFDTVVVVEGCDALVVGMMPVGMWL